jgi:Ulp1 family protease
MYPHFTPIHYNVVIAIKEDMQVDLVWCDSLQWNGQQSLVTYAQYYHFLEQDMNRPTRYQSNRHYSSALTIRTHSPALPRKTNGTDCGIFTLLYHRTLSNWYGITAGQTFTQGHIQELLRSLGQVTQETAHEYRRRLCIQMHTWWTETWEGPNSVLPPGVHQRNLQMRRQRRRELQESLSYRT